LSRPYIDGQLWRYHRQPGGSVVWVRSPGAAQGRDVTVSRLGRFYRATWEIAGQGEGQSRTVWTKVINSEGRTIRLYHDSYDRAGRFQHRKFKPVAQ
jgi:hypothetical protein